MAAPRVPGLECAAQFRRTLRYEAIGRDRCCSAVWSASCRTDRLMKPSIVLLWLLLGLSCSDARGLNGQVVGTVNRGIDDLDRHETEHIAWVAAASSVDAIRDSENDHRAILDADFAAIRSGLDSIAECTLMTDNVFVDTGAVRDALQDAKIERDRHEERAEPLNDLASLKAEEDRHAKTMSGVVADLKLRRDQMLSRAARAVCP